MKLRDHDQECKHGAMGPHTMTLTDSTVPSLFASVGICPGGREVEIDYEAARRRYGGIDWTNQPSNPLAVADWIVDAALGIQR